VNEPNLEDFSDLDNEDMQEEGLNTMSPHELETEVKKESDMSVLMVGARQPDSDYTWIIRETSQQLDPYL